MLGNDNESKGACSPSGANVAEAYENTGSSLLASASLLLLSPRCLAAAVRLTNTPVPLPPICLAASTTTT